MTARGGAWCASVVIAAVAAPAVAQTLPPPMLLSVTLNGKAQEVGTFYRGADGRVLVSAESTREWRLRLPPPSGEERTIDLSAVSGLRLSIDEASQSIAIVAPPELFERTLASFADPVPGTRAERSRGAYLDYDLFLTREGGFTGVGGFAQGVVFTQAGVGGSSLALRSDSDGRQQVLRLESDWTIDAPGRLTTLTLGDAITKGGIGGLPLRFGGLRYARNFATLPGFVTLPLPRADGSAALPSVVDLYVDGALRASRQVDPGPFSLAQVPVVSGGGAVEVVVRDISGREVRTSLPYYTVGQSLARGLHDFSYELGFVRQRFGFASNDYGSWLASTTQRYGVNERLTVEGHAAATRSTALVGAGGTLALPGLGAVTLGVAGSRAEGRTGLNLSAGVERRTARVSVGGRIDTFTLGYSYVGDQGARVPRSIAQAFATVRVGRSSVGANFARQSFRFGELQQVASAFYARPIGRRASAQLFARHIDAGRADWSLGFILTAQLSTRWTGNSFGQAGRTSQQVTATVSRDAPYGEGWGALASATLGDGGGGQVSGEWRRAAGVATLDLAVRDGEAAARAGVSGSVGVIEGRPFAARKLGRAFALVDGGRAGIKVYADNQLVGTTGRRGLLVVPELRPFDANPIAIDPLDVPIEDDLGAVERSVTPYDRSGALVRYLTEPSQSVLFELRIGGEPVPPGAAVTMADRSTTIVAQDGQVYLRGVSKDRSGLASWEGGACRFVVPEGASLADPRIVECAMVADAPARP